MIYFVQKTLKIYINCIKKLQMEEYYEKNIRCNIR